MTMINNAPIDANGRVFVETSFPTVVSSSGGLSYNAAGALACDTTNGAPTSFLAGLSFLGKYLRIQDNLALTPAVPTKRNGLSFNLNSELMCTSTEPVAGWVHGWPVSAAGFVCIGTATPPVLDAFTDGFDGGFG